VTALVGTRVLLTGATGGLGHAIARALAERGAHLVLSGRRADALEPLAAETGGDTVVADLAVRGDVQRLAREAGDIDLLVANAALPASGELADYSIEQIDRALEVNLRAPIVLTKLLSAGMMERGRGHLVFISSVAGKLATPGGSLYSASKFGVRGFAGGMRQDLHGRGVGVSVVFPGFISGAGMYADSGVKLPPGVGTKTPEDVGAAVVSAIEDNRGEIDVATLSTRITAKVAAVAPEFVENLGRRFGSDKLAAEMGEAQRDKR
jgi:short-subunit dehydrogenase